MVRYRRNLRPGGTFFFTVTLNDRRSSVLVDHVDKLRDAFRVTRTERPFTVDAIVILPDHLHVIMSLPQDDSDFPGRWKRIKSLFRHQLTASGAPISRNHRGEFSLWQRRFWEHTIRNEADFERCADYVHFSPVKHGLSRHRWTGRTRRSIATFAPACCPPIGEAPARSPAISVNAETEPRIALRSIRATDPNYDRNPGASCPVLATYSV